MTKMTNIEQISIFEMSKKRYQIVKPIRLIELFAGIGSQAKALKNLNVNFEHYKIVEFDKYAIASYNAIHGTNFETQDITKIGAKDLEIVDTDKYDYILTYSFPCTDLSLAGDRKGMTKGSGTRSGLLWEVERLLDECLDLPQILLMENVPQVINKDFHEWQLKLESLGYSNYTDILNAKDYGIPQNRNRCFMVSILGDYYYKFPQKKKLKLRLKDLLEDEVDEKYYLSEKMITYISQPGTKNFKVDTRINLNVARPITTEQSKRAGTTNYISEKLPSNVDLNSMKFSCSKLEKKMGKNGIIPTKCVKDYNDPKLVQVVQLDGFESSGRIYSQEGLCPTINTMGGGQREPKIIVPEATKKGYVEAHEGDGVYINRPQQKRGVVQKGMIQTIKTQSDDIGVVVKDKPIIPFGSYYTWEDNQGNINTQCNRAANPNESALTVACAEPGKVLNNLRIRKLTPLECWRLMGFSDLDFEKASKVNSNAQLYKQAGNSIVVNVLMEIFRGMI